MLPGVKTVLSSLAIHLEAHAGVRSLPEGLVRGAVRVEGISLSLTCVFTHVHTCTHMHTSCTWSFPTCPRQSAVPDPYTGAEGVLGCEGTGDYLAAAWALPVWGAVRGMEATGAGAQASSNAEP